MPGILNPATAPYQHSPGEVAGDGSSSWVPAMQVGHLDRAPAPGFRLAVEGLWEWTRGWEISMLLYLSNKYMKNLKATGSLGKHLEEGSDEEPMKFWKVSWMVMVAVITWGWWNLLWAEPLAASQKDGILAGTWGSEITAPPMKAQRDPHLSFHVKRGLRPSCTSLPDSFSSVALSFNVCLFASWGRETCDHGSLE